VCFAGREFPADSKEAAIIQKYERGTSQAELSVAEGFGAGDPARFNRRSVRYKFTYERGELSAAENIYNLLDAEAKAEVDEYVEHELQLWDKSKTENKRSLWRMLVYEALNYSPVYIHFGLLTPQQRKGEVFKPRKKKPKKESGDLLEIWQNT
jgi:hypothetical protein